tara:strand:+ start:51 stop:626 length:576 start_codon:yes stop_codon:yes gene_type:complete
MISRKLIIGAASGLLGALALAGAVVAQEDSPNKENSRNAINDRVAEILGIEREDLDSAMQVARKEHHEKKREEHLSALVEAGTITQEQADEIKAWQNNKPEAMNKLNKLKLDDLKNRRAKKDFRKPNKKKHEIKHGFANKLSILVEKEVITQIEANEIITWLQEKPEYVVDLRKKHKADAKRFETKLSVGS